MNLEQQLKSASIIDYNQLCALLQEYKRPRDKITNLLRNHVLLRVKKGLYIPFDSTERPLETLANLIYGPSYISREMALSYYGLIPERVYEYTSMTLGRKKSFETPVGRFRYLPISSSAYYAEGIIRQQTGSQPFLIATKEKALCDLFYEKKFTSLSESKKYLEGLRIEKKYLKNLNIKLIQKLAKISKKESLEHLLKCLEKLR